MSRGYLHGAQQPGRAAPPATIDDTRADGRTWRPDQTHAVRVRLRRCASRACRDTFRERPRAGLAHIARRGAWFRDRARPPRARTNSSLHAARRARLARAVEYV